MTKEEINKRIHEITCLRFQLLTKVKWNDDDYSTDKKLISEFNQLLSELEEK